MSEPFDEQAELARILQDIAADAAANHRPGTCGACVHFSAKVSYDWGQPDAGKCWGWREDDAEFVLDEDGQSGWWYETHRWMWADQTCERYMEDVRMREERAKNLPWRIRAHLGIARRRGGLS